MPPRPPDPLIGNVNSEIKYNMSTNQYSITFCGTLWYQHSIVQLFFLWATWWYICISGSGAYITKTNEMYHRDAQSRNRVSQR